ncbi:MAG: hypothetical protein ACR2HP_10930 [Ilumatobacteraceae bacterium]
MPVLLLATLAVDRSMHGAGLGGDLLLDALVRALRAARAYGAGAVISHRRARG